MKTGVKIFTIFIKCINLQFSNRIANAFLPIGCRYIMIWDGKISPRMQAEEHGAEIGTWRPAKEVVS